MESKTSLWIGNLDILSRKPAQYPLSPCTIRKLGKRGVHYFVDYAELQRMLEIHGDSYAPEPTQGEFKYFYFMYIKLDDLLLIPFVFCAITVAMLDVVSSLPQIKVEEDSVQECIVDGS